MGAILITGAGGFIGACLARRLTAAGRAVVGIDRQSPGPEVCRWGYARLLGTPLADVCARHAPEVAIHCAYDPDPRAAEKNEEGTRAWAEQLRREGCSRQVFFSSISARPGALAPYGQLKYRLEQWFLSWNGVVVRPGLVVGPGGLFARMVAFTRRFPVVPLVDGGRTRVYFTGVDFLVDAVAGLVQGSPADGAWNLHQPQPTSMRALLQAVCKTLGIQRAFAPVPYGLCLGAAMALENLPWPAVGIRSDNVRGLRQNNTLDLPSHVAELGGREESIDILVQRALLGGAREQETRANHVAKAA